MSNTLNRLLKIVATIQDSRDSGALGIFDSFCTQCDAFLKKHAHMVPHNDGTTPNPWRRNMDYSEFDRSPYYGSVSEFMEKFPDGIREWVEWRNKSKKDRFKRWDIKKRTSYLENLMKDAFYREPGREMTAKEKAMRALEQEKEKSCFICKDIEPEEDLMLIEGEIKNVHRGCLEEGLKHDFEPARDFYSKNYDQLSGKLFSHAYFKPVGPDDVEKFENEPHLYSDEGLEKFKSVKEYVEKRRKALGQGADDAALSAVKDFISYWKLLLKGKEKRKRTKRKKRRQ